MKISVIVPTYKPKDYLWECLDSMYNQTLPYNDFEVVIVLNGCKEPYYTNIWKYINEHPKINWRYLHTDEGGVSNARNMALDAAKGDYITFLNGVKRQIIKICYIDLKQGSTDFLCHYIYGEPLSLVLNEWLLNATFEGHGRTAVSQEKCLIIWYKKNGKKHSIKI